jgi:hypothetical protein
LKFADFAMCGLNLLQKEPHKAYDTSGTVYTPLKHKFGIPGLDDRSHLTFVGVSGDKHVH